jgi:beta-N-acetylhexosaminidase
VVRAVLTALAIAAAAIVPAAGRSSGGAAPPAQLRLVQRLSAAQLAGQRIIYAYSGLTPPASLLRAIRGGEAAGMILFGENISSVAQIHAVMRELQRAAMASPLHTRLLIMTDQEGGEVRRLPGPPALSERRIGQSANGGALAFQAGAGAGRNLRGAGVNVNLAPVLDVFRRPRDFIDRFQRSYSSNPATVARLGAAFIAAQQHTGVAATAKHFPGLGAAAADQDTDARPVSLEVSAGALRVVDEAPYRSAIAAGVKLVMTSWAVYPALDGRRPAGLSPVVIGRELRGRLRFRGVIVTDAITAGALGGFGSPGARAVLAAQAGADLILCTSPTSGQNALQALTVALEHGRLSRVAAQQAAARVLALRAHP